jgi:hypothetical protein
MFPGVDSGFPCGMWCSPVLSIDMQASLELVVVVAAVERNGTKFSQCNMVWQAFHRLGVHDVESLILVDALFLLDGEGEEKERKKKRKRKKSPWGRRVPQG